MSIDPSPNPDPSGKPKLAAMTPEGAFTPKGFAGRFGPRERSWRDVMLGTPGRIALLVLIAVIAYVAFQIAIDNSPREQDRYRFENAYSLVKPRGWEVKTTTKPNGKFRDGFTLTPIDWKGLSPTINVSRLNGPMSAADLTAGNYTPITFQNQPAMASELVRKRFRGRDVIFQRNGTWYVITVSLADAEFIRMDQWWKFAQTFAVETVGDAGTSAASQPGR